MKKSSPPHPVAKILVIEDDEDMRLAIADALTDEGYQVVSTQRGDEAVTRAAGESFDLVISDIKMPGMDGLEAVQGVLGHQPSASAIIVTGYSTEAYALRAVQIGVSEYLKKPFRLGDFLQRVRFVLDERRRRFQLEWRNEQLRVASLSSLQTLAQLLESQTEGSLLDAGQTAAQLARSECQHLESDAELVALLAGCEALAPELQAPNFGTQIANLVAAVEERWDGSGPTQLKGMEIPFLSRVAKIALALKVHRLSVFCPETFDPRLIQSLGEGQEPRSTDPSRSPRLSLLSLGQAMMRTNDLETAFHAFSEIVANHPETSEASLALLGLYQISQITDNTPETTRQGEDPVEEVIRTAESQGYAHKAFVFLTLGILLLERDAPRAKELLQRAEVLCKQLGDESSLAQVTLALTALHGAWDSSADQSLDHLLLPENEAALTENAKWLLPVLLECAKPQTLVLLRRRPDAFLECLDRSTVTVDAKIRVLELLRQSKKPISSSVLLRLVSDSDPGVSQLAQELLHGETVDKSLPTLKIHSFGTFRTQFNEETLEGDRWKRKKIKHLLAFLARHWRRPVSEDIVIENFWPGNVDRAKRSLYQATWELRRSLRHSGWPNLDFIERKSGFLSLNSRLPIWNDIEEFEKAYDRARASESHGRSREAAADYAQVVEIGRGTFLEDCYLDWAIQTRESLQNKLLLAHGSLGKFGLQQQEPKKAKEHAMAMLEIDKLDQLGQKLMMEACLKLGLIEEATRRFHDYRQLLHQELDLEPTRELFSLLEQAKLQR